MSTPERGLTDRVCRLLTSEGVPKNQPLVVFKFGHLVQINFMTPSELKTLFKVTREQMSDPVMVFTNYHKTIANEIFDLVEQGKHVTQADVETRKKIIITTVWVMIKLAIDKGDELFVASFMRDDSDNIVDFERVPVGGFPYRKTARMKEMEKALQGNYNVWIMDE